MAQQQDQEEQQQGNQSQDRDRGQIGFTPTGGMNRDLLDAAVGNTKYFHALNASVNLPDGGVGAFHTETGNIISHDNSSFTLIGIIPLSESKYVVYYTQNTPSITGLPSQSGIYNELDNSYNVLIDDT